MDNDFSQFYEADIWSRASSLSVAVALSHLKNSGKHKVIYVQKSILL